MTAHISSCRRSTTCRRRSAARMLTGLLRDELGFDGMVITDALEMQAVSATGRDGGGRRAGARRRGRRALPRARHRRGSRGPRTRRRSSPRCVSGTAERGAARRGRGARGGIARGRVRRRAGGRVRATSASRPPGARARRGTVAGGGPCSSSSSRERLGRGGAALPRSQRDHERARRRRGALNLMESEPAALVAAVRAQPGAVR